MAKVQEFYKGRRKRRNLAIVPFIILLLIISLAVVLFYGMQKYAVITKEGVSVELPILNEGKTVINSEGKEVRAFEQVDAEIVFREPDYSSVKAEAGNSLSGVRAIFVPYTEMDRDKLIAYAARLVSGNALVLEMKPRSGELMWESHSDMAANYSLSPATELTNAMPEYIGILKEQGVYLVAQISCCIDEMLPMRTSNFCIHNEMGLNYRDEVGIWLDAYNLQLRDYVVQMVEELYDLGFDEVVLADVAHPTLAEPVPLLYTREMSTERNTVTAVCGFALSVADRLRDREKLLSIYIDTRTALVKADESTGQSGPLFMKVFDRVYIRTDKYAYPYNADDIRPYVEIGSVYDRLVPVVENYIPSDNTSWVLIDVEEE